MRHPTSEVGDDSSSSTLMHLFPNHLVVVASDLEASSLHVVASLYSGYSLLHVLPMFTDTILYS